MFFLHCVLNERQKLINLALLVKSPRVQVETFVSSFRHLDNIWFAGLHLKQVDQHNPPHQSYLVSLQGERVT